MISDPILEAFAATAARRGPAPLVASIARSISVEEVDRAALELARRLSAEGIGEGAAVGLAAAPGPALLIGYLALRRGGSVPVLCDEARPTADRRTALGRLGVTAFLAEASGWPGAAADWSIDRRREATSSADLIDSAHRPHQIDPQWGAIKLTSGSTGEPRGIAVRSAALLADDAQLARSMGLVAEDRFLTAIPLSHSYGFSSLLLPALVRGSLLIVAADRSPFGLLAAAAELGATVFPTVPAWIGAFARAEGAPPLASSVRLVIAAGAPLPAAAAARFRRRTGRGVHIFYGASESGGIAYDRTGSAAERGTVGRPVDGVEVVRDAVAGRLSVRSAAVAECYLPESDAALCDGTFITGDLGDLVDGEIVLRGRADDCVIVRGRNVQPAEIEEAIAALPGIAEVAVFGVDGPDGPRSQLLAVVAAPHGGVDAQTIAGHLSRDLAAYKIPRRIVVVDELPRNERGKLDRPALAGMATSR